ncbi:MAG: YndJ family transporter [Chloroflexi bacterium]|nr:YndJ family transporter [Chloroflexota bacterium]
MNPWQKANLTGGILSWVVFLFLSVAAFSIVTQIHVLILASILIFAPIVLALLNRQNHSEQIPIGLRIVERTQLAAGLLIMLSFWIGQSVPAALLTVPWLAVTGLIALYGLGRLLARGTSPIEETVLDIGLMHLPVGGVWLLLDRAGIQPLSFDSLGALFLGAMQGRLLRTHRPQMIDMYRAAAIAVMVGPSLVAAGIVFSLAVEVFAATVLAGGLLLSAALTLRYIVPRLQSTLTMTLLAVSAICLFLTMSLAVAYPLGRLTGWWSLSIPQMVFLHA